MSYNYCQKEFSKTKSATFHGHQPNTSRHLTLSEYLKPIFLGNPHVTYGLVEDAEFHLGAKGKIVSILINNNTLNKQYLLASIHMWHNSLGARNVFCVQLNAGKHEVSRYNELVKFERTDCNSFSHPPLGDIKCLRVLEQSALVLSSGHEFPRGRFGCRHW